MEEREMCKKRLIALGLAAVMAFSLAGCGGSGQGGNSAATAVAIPEGLWDPYEEEVVLTTVVEENSGTNFQNGDTYDDNTWYRAYKERFNIQVKNLWVSNDYGTKLNLSIADKDIPDVFHVDGKQLEQLEKSGLIMDLTELFDKYASDNLKSYMEQEKDTYETGCYDGKLYGIPQLSYGIIDQFQYVWIRKDWKEQLGLADPQTMDDVAAIAKAFVENFDECEYGLAEYQSLDNMNRLALGFGAHTGVWLEQEDGTIEYGSIQPEMKEMLALYAQWYADGIINPDFATTKYEKMCEDVINGKCGVVPFAQWFGYNPGPNIVDNLGAEAIFEPYPIPSANGQEVKGTVSFGNRGYIVISNKCKNPEAAIKLINFWCYMMDDAAGNEDPEFISSLFDNNYPNIPYGLCVINPNTDYNQYIQVTEALARGLDEDTTAMGSNASKYNSCVAWVRNQDSSGVGDWLQQGNDKSAYGIAKEYVDNKTYVKNAVWGLDTPLMQSYGSTLYGQLTIGFTEIIQGTQPIDYFDTLVQNWKDAGGDQVTAEVNEIYGNK